MAELALWKAFLDRDDLQALDPVDVLALIAVGVEIATNLPDLDGFLPRSGARRVSWMLGVQDLVERLDTRLTLEGFVQHLDEPSGWLLAGWLEKSYFYKAGNSDTGPIAWGQKSSASWKKVAADARERQARLRRASKDADSANP